MLGFFEPVCRTICSPGVYNYLGQHFWPHLLNQSMNIAPVVIGAGIVTAGVAVAAVVYYRVTGKENIEPEVAAPVLTAPTPESTKPMASPTTSALTTKVDARRKRSAIKRMPTPAIPLVMPVHAIETTAEPLTKREDTPEIVVESIKGKRAEAEQAFTTHAVRLTEMMEEGMPQRKELQAATDDNDLNITEKMFVAMYLSKYPNPSIKTRHILPQARQQALKEVFHLCEETLGIPEMRDLNDYPKTPEGKAIIRRAYDQLKPKTKPE